MRYFKRGGAKMKKLIMLLSAFALLNLANCEVMRDRFLWIFGFDFQKEEEIPKIEISLKGFPLRMPSLSSRETKLPSFPIQM
jgi:hypothetical protein